MKISGNTILVTGGGTGIGLALVELLELDNQIVICGRRKDKLEDVKKRYPKIHYKVCDLQFPEQRIEFTEWLLKNHPGLNILLNNAGIQREISFLETNKFDKLSVETEINLFTPVHLSNLLIPHLIGKKEACIINISSGLGFTPLAMMPMYCATKAALHSFSLSLRHQLAKTCIKIFEIIPPMVDTELDQNRSKAGERAYRGMPVKEFAALAINALKNDIYEAAIGQAENLRSKREELFNSLNS
jgi:uncharacterized oxidoreductase